VTYRESQGYPTTLREVIEGATEAHMAAIESVPVAMTSGGETHRKQPGQPFPKIKSE
jgi:hypothetical protein